MPRQAGLRTPARQRRHGASRPPQARDSRFACRDFVPFSWMADEGRSGNAAEEGAVVNQDLERQRIVVGVHGSAASLAGLCWAAREAGLRGASLHLVCAWEDTAKQVAPYAPHLHRQSRWQNRAAARASLRAAVMTVIGPSPAVTLMLEVADGLPARVLIDRAACAGLLVLGSANRDAPGPVIRVCLHHAHCPVVLVSERTADLPVPA